MLAYAANAPRHAERRSSPNALLAIIALHVGLLAAVMSVKMDLPQRIKSSPIDIFFVPTPPPPADQPRLQPRQLPHDTFTQPPQPVPVPLPPSDGPAADPAPLPGPGPVVGPGSGAGPVVEPAPTPAPVRIGARLLTPAAELKPPYPQSKLLAEEEAVLKLRLTIDPRGRVVAVEPVAAADPTFLLAARRHLIAHWRYKPATENGRAVTSSLVITLRFQLDA